MLAEEAHLTSHHQPKHVKFMDTTKENFASSTPLRHQEEWPYHQCLLLKTTLGKSVSMQLLTNSGKCGSQKLVN